MPKQDVALELYYSGSWHNLVTDDEVFADAPITIRRGLGDESGGWPRPAQITARLNNASDKYRTSNPESPLYGLAGRNTPMRVSVGGSVRGIVEASSWAADQTRDFRATPRRGKAWVDVAGGGLLQRVGQWKQPLRSPFYTYNTRNIGSLAGYWPMEDESGAVRATSTVPGAENTVLTGVSFQSQQRAPGSGPGASVLLQTGATFNFTGGDPNSTAGWQYSFVTYMADPNGGFPTLMHADALNGSRFFAALNDATHEILLQVVVNGVSVINTTFSDGGYEWTGRWVMFVIHAAYAAGTTSFKFRWRAIDEDSWLEVGDTYSGIPSNLDIAFVTNGGGIPNGSTFGHVIATHSHLEDLSSDDRWDAFLGHPGERAAYRFGRLIDQELGPGHYYVSDSFADSMPMGPQPVASLSDLIKECITTEDALVYDHGTDLRLFFLCRADRYNQTPALELTPTDLTILPKEVNDDKLAGNIVTASQRDGGDWTVRDDTGPLGTQPPPNGAGEEKRTINVNVDNPASMLPQVANWWLRRGTVDLPRFPQLTIDLNANPGLIADVEAIRPGYIVTLTGFRENVIRLYVLGWTETIGTHSRTITFICAPDQQFQVGEWDSTASRYDLAGSALDGGPWGATATALTVSIPSFGNCWSQTSLPYDVFIAGERMTVTAMSAPYGGLGFQDLTVTRSVNGVVKELPANAEMRIATPGRWAL